ncbi:unnamed protein product [Clonostachys rhizophaga]|uniref:Uncharacterized protein n=1 Tax=Clonostachys rhizophaga TaxID=160324 RepID=A0A9N9YM10_9HYPO|nr:unnamed protein product [Clonostachys rhizophaga]
MRAASQYGYRPFQTSTPRILFVLHTKTGKLLLDHHYCQRSTYLALDTLVYTWDTLLEKPFAMFVAVAAAAAVVICLNPRDPCQGIPGEGKGQRSQKKLKKAMKPTR